MDTVPASTLLDAVGINFNVKGNQVAPTARLLGNSGFRRARLEVSWGTIDYADPNQMLAGNRAELSAKLTALRENGLRPLIVLNSNHGRPCPVQPVTLSLLSPAPAGATQVRLDPATIEPGEIVPGRTGITSSGVAANNLFTSVDPQGNAVLSKPLKESLPAGPLSATTLRYEPFSPPTLPDGDPNPRSAATMAGWLSYVRVVTREAKAILGSDEFDVEVWNELSFGSNFLNINNYYEPDIEAASPGHDELLRRTVELLRDPATGLPDVQIGNGFANQSPHGKGPYGTAIDKHPYAGLYRFPRDKDRWLVRPLNGLGEPDGVRDASGTWHDSFTPTFDSYFPEYFLSAIQPETLIRDLAPYVSSSGDKAGAESHGRSVTFEGSSGPSPVWVTEVNLPPEEGTTPAAEMSSADRSHVEAKSILRYLVSFVNKGVKAIDFYAANDGRFSLIDKGFFAALKSQPGQYPGDSSGGDTTDAVRRLVEAMRGATRITSPRAISLGSVTDYSGNYQFAGDGTAAHPPLFNRDVLAFFPFQVTDRRFVIPTYVMTRNVTEVYDPGRPSDPSRFDLPAEPYGLDIDGVDGIGAEVEALDPLSGDSTPVEITGRGEDHLEVKMEVTDSPRLLVVSEAGDGTGPEPPVEWEEPESPGEPEPPAEPEPPVEPESPGEPEGGHESPSEPEPGEEPGYPSRPDQIPTAPAAPAAPGQPNPRAPSSGGGHDAPSVSLRLESRRSLLRDNRLTVVTSCDAPCRVAIHGRLGVGSRQLSLKAPARASSLERSRTRSTVDLVIDGRVARLIRAAFASRQPVSVTVSATATTAGGGSTTTSRTLPLSSPRRQPRTALRRWRVPAAASRPGRFPP